MEADMAGIVERFNGLVKRSSVRLSWLPSTLARLTLGLVFIGTGWGKLHSLPDVTEFFASLHIPQPHFNAVLVANTELIGGILLLLGLVARFASLPIVVMMVVAILTAKMDDVHGLSDLVGLQEFDYIVLALWIAVAGPGPLSIDRLVAWFWSRRGRSNRGASVSTQAT